jgi:outer membrane protein OmpA-like peptidoglycan-associated protein
LRIEGHCDDRGTVEYNMDLSQRRCNTTKEKLVSLGVAANRIITVGKGKSSPRVGPSGKNGTFTEFERDRNRRTEFTLE